MADTFLNLSRPVRVQPQEESRTGHETRKHSKFSASGADRWFKCPGSVQLSEGLPDKSSPWAEEGTRAHEVLEAYMRVTLSGNDGAAVEEYRALVRQVPREMAAHAEKAGDFIFGIAAKHPGSEVLVESRVELAFVHPEAFGTFDGAVVDHFGTLHVFDFKYGAGHAVSVRENLQMIFYGLGLAFRYDWNFKRVRLWIIQPRIKGYDGPTWWELTMEELRRKFLPLFLQAVRRVETFPELFAEGRHCHWCKAKSKCPLKLQAKLDSAVEIFSMKGIS